MNVNFEPIIRGLQSDIFVKSVSYMQANAILNFHFDYPHPSLIEFSEGSDEEERGDVGGDKRHNHCARLTHDKVNIERKMDLEIVV